MFGGEDCIQPRLHPLADSPQHGDGCEGQDGHEGNGKQRLRSLLFALLAVIVAAYAGPLNVYIASDALQVVFLA